MSANLEPKSAASLSAGLLARKGGARPSMRRQPISILPAGAISHSDDLGWNDMGDDLPAHANTESPIADQISAIAERISGLKQKGAVTPAPAPSHPGPQQEKRRPKALASLDSKEDAKSLLVAQRPVTRRTDAERKVAFTLRLTGERHLRLRLLSALSNSSAQQLLVEALDSIISENEQLQSLASQIEAKRA